MLINRTLEDHLDCSPDGVLAPGFLESRCITGNQVDVLRDGDQTLPAAFAAIRRALHFVHLEYYVFEDIQVGGERLGRLLVEKRSTGVQVAVIYDAVGSSSTPSGFLDMLRRAGVYLACFNDMRHRRRHFASPNRRDHRKMLIVDGSLAIVGGVNLSSVYETSLTRVTALQPDRSLKTPHWRDTDLRVQGPAVAQLQALFLKQWGEETGAALPDVGSFPAPPTQGEEGVRIIASTANHRSSHYYVVLLARLHTARNRVWITEGYFLPTREQKQALIDAVGRGVDVRLMVAAHNDSTGALAVQRSAYAELLRAGIRIYERAGAILHSKSVIIDQDWAAVGSSNMDRRSQRFNDELDVVVLGRDTAGALSRLFVDDLRHAHVITRDAWRGRPWHQRLKEIFWKRLEWAL